jgi:hypothetical protein
VFGGDAQGLRRARDFTGPIPTVDRVRGRASVDELTVPPPRPDSGARPAEPTASRSPAADA